MLAYWRYNDLNQSYIPSDILPLQSPVRKLQKTHSQQKQWNNCISELNIPLSYLVRKHNRLSFPVAFWAITLHAFIVSIVKSEFLTIKSFFIYSPELACWHLRTAPLSLHWTPLIFSISLLFQLSLFFKLVTYRVFFFPVICLFYPSSDSASPAPRDCFFYPSALLASFHAMFLFFLTCLLSSLHSTEARLKMSFSVSARFSKEIVL